MKFGKVGGMWHGVESIELELVSFLIACHDGCVCLFDPRF